MTKLVSAADYEIDLSGWELDSIPDLKTIALNAATEVLKIIFSGEIDTARPRVYLPTIWGPDSDGLEGAAPENPLTVYLRIPLCDAENEPPTWKFTIDEMILDFLQDVEEPAIMEAVRDALRQQADLIDRNLRQL